MKKKKELVLGGILLLGIGFALVTTTLYINGNVNISANTEDFDVKFTKAVVDGTNLSDSIISSDGKTITYTTKELEALNDKSILDFEITNNSSIYDAEVSIDCTSREKGEYYQITKEVENIIPARYKRPGKVEVEKIKLAEEDIEEQFTCTLVASAVERTTKGENPTTPVCSFTTVPRIKLGETTQVKLSCIDSKNDIESKILTKEDFKISNENIQIASITEPTKIENGYAWDINITGSNLGTSNISLNESSIKNKINYGNNKVTTENIEVVEYNPNIVGTVPNCVMNKTAGSCGPGTEIRYMVNDSEEKTFYVLHDDGNTMTLQQRENTINSIKWYGNSAYNTSGPLTVLGELEKVTAGWNNVNTLNYTMGTTVFKDSPYTGCWESTCTVNTYTLENRSSKARMITFQEAVALGCSSEERSCPIWMYNYLKASTSYGGTATGDDVSYWTMSASSDRNDFAWRIHQNGVIHSINSIYTYGARAVIEINK